MDKYLALSSCLLIGMYAIIHYTMVTKIACLDALRKVIDPEIGVNIVDVGLIYRVDVSDEAVEVDYTLTSPGCPLAETIKQDIERYVGEAADGLEVKVDLVWAPPWHIDFMSEEARLELGYPI